MPVHGCTGEYVGGVEGANRTFATGTPNPPLPNPAGMRNSMPFFYVQTEEATDTNKCGEWRIRNFYYVWFEARHRSLKPANRYKHPISKKSTES